MSQQSKETSTITITLVKSPIGRPYPQRILLRGLGLRKLHQAVQRESTPQVMGIINKVRHLVKVNTL